MGAVGLRKLGSVPAKWQILLTQIGETLPSMCAVNTDLADFFPSWIRDDIWHHWILPRDRFSISPSPATFLLDARQKIMRFSIDRFSIKPFASGFLHVPLFLVHFSLRVKLILLLDGLITINFDVAKAEKDRSPVRDLITEIRPGDNHRSQNIPRMIANYRYGECIVPDPDRRRRVSTTSLISS